MAINDLIQKSKDLINQEDIQGIIELYQSSDLQNLTSEDRKRFYSEFSPYLSDKLRKLITELDIMIEDLSPPESYSLRQSLNSWRGAPSTKLAPELPPTETFVSELVSKGKLTEDNSKKFIKLAREYNNTKASCSLLEMLCSDDPSIITDAFKDYPDFYYSDWSGYPHAYDDIQIPEGLGERVIHSLSNKLASPRSDKILNQIYAEHFLKSKEFKGWVFKAKLSGKDLGFILQEPNSNQRWFVKHTGNDVTEYFVSLLLNQLGVKYPESKLLKAESGVYFIATKDLKRTYTKNEKIKQKGFDALLFDSDPRVQTLARNSPDKSFSKYDIEEQKQIESYVDDLFGPKESKDPNHVKMRNSFARMLICGRLLDLSDLGGHLGNTGIISRPLGESSPKIGLVDFQTRIRPITLGDSSSLDQFVLSLIQGLGTHFLFKMFAERITVDDIKQAFLDIQNPKMRVEQKGLFLTQGREKKTSFESLVSSCVEQFKVTVPEGASEEQLEEINKLSDIIINNINIMKQLKLSDDPNIERTVTAHPSSPKKT